MPDARVNEVILLYYYTATLLHYYTTKLLHYYTTILLYCYFTLTPFLPHYSDNLKPPSPRPGLPEARVKAAVETARASSKAC